jgi:hypothetical protein
MEDGVLKIGLRKEPMAPLNDDYTRETNAAIQEMLKQKLHGDKLTGKEEIATSLHFLSLLCKMNILVDWNTLTKAGVLKDAKLDIDTSNQTVEDFLNAVFAAMKPTTGKVGYQIEDGTLRISTQSVLDGK